MNASGVPRTEAKAIIVTANARNPRRVSVRLSNGARTVPIASAPTSAPVPHVAYSHLYVTVFGSMPNAKSATAGNSPTNGKQSSENELIESSILPMVFLSRAMRNPAVND